MGYLIFLCIVRNSLLWVYNLTVSQQREKPLYKAKVVIFFNKVLFHIQYKIYTCCMVKRNSNTDIKKQRLQSYSTADAKKIIIYLHNKKTFLRSFSNLCTPTESFLITASPPTYRMLIIFYAFITTLPYTAANTQFRFLLSYLLYAIHTAHATVH